MQPGAGNERPGMPALGAWLALPSASLVAGWFVPEYYDWTGADQSRPAPVVGYTALAIMILDALIVATLVWSRWGQSVDASTAQSHQFSIGRLMLWTAAVAGILVALRTVPWLAGGVVFIMAALWSAWVAFRFPTTRWPIAVLALCMYGPFLWLMRMPEFPGLVWQIVLLASLPATMPMLLAQSVTNVHFELWQWLGSAAAGVELWCGVALIQRGPTRSVVFMLAALTLSLFGSFVLHALFRM